MQRATPPTVGENLFYECSKLQTIYVPAGAAEAYNVAPWNAYNIVEQVEIINPMLVDSLYYNVDVENKTAEVVAVPNDTKYSGDIVVPASISINGIEFAVTSIEQSAFSSCSGLTSIKIPTSVTAIGDDAFYNCSGLTSIPNSVTAIGGGAFAYCIGLKTVINCSTLDISAGSSNHGGVAEYADKVVNVDEQIGDLFFYKTTLTGYVGNQSELALLEDYNDKKYMIGNSAFRDNTNLTSVFIPASVTGIEENAFDGCGNLANLTMASPVPPASVYENSFGTINYIYTTLYVPEGSLAAYQTANVWKYFMKIKEYDPTGIEDVVFDTESSNLPIYNLQGVRMKDVDNLPSGIHIQGGKNFVVK